MAGGAAAGSSGEEWRILQEEIINKLIANLETEKITNITTAEIMRGYTLVYNLATTSRIAQEELYDHYYKRTFDDYISYKILPCLRGKENENLLRELLKGWNIYRTMTKHLSKMFLYLSGEAIPLMNRLPSLVQIAYLTFYDRVCGEYRDQIAYAIITLINRERLGEQIDQDMVKQVLDIFQEFGEESFKNYMKYSEKIGGSNYMNKMVESCGDEETAVSEYLGLTEEDKICEAYAEIKNQVCGAIVLALRRNCYSPVIDKPLLKQIRQTVKEICSGALKIYAQDIEEALINSTAFFYSTKAVEWINASQSYEDYMLKVDECVEKENFRFSGYLRLINKTRILEVVQHELLKVHAAS